MFACAWRAAARRLEACPLCALRDPSSVTPEPDARLEPVGELVLLRVRGSSRRDTHGAPCRDGTRRAHDAAAGENQRRETGRGRRL